MPCTEMNKRNEKSILKRKIKKIFWQTKWIVVSSEIFRHTLYKGLILNMCPEKDDKICFDDKTNANTSKKLVIFI